LQGSFPDEVNALRDVISRKVVETGLLSEDGSMPGAYFLAWNESDAGVQLFPSVVESTIANSNARFVPQEKVKDVIPCKESMQDLFPPRQKERGTGSCVVVVPSRYVRQYKWPLSQLKVGNFISIFSSLYAQTSGLCQYLEWTVTHFAVRVLSDYERHLLFRSPNDVFGSTQNYSGRHFKSPSALTAGNYFEVICFPCFFRHEVKMFHTLHC
jgi:hypothetical protein